MADIKPFAGLRAPEALAGKVASPPYDVISCAEAKAIVAENPMSFLRVIRPDIEFDDSIANLDERLFATGRNNLELFKEKGWLVADAKPAFYLYEQVMGEHRQIGLVAGASATEYRVGKIKRHEFTRPAKEMERTKHIQATGTNTGMVFLTYRAQASIDALVGQICQRPAVYDFVANDRVEHRLWLVDQDEEITELERLFADVPNLYVADGHHRTAAAEHVQTARQEQNGEHQGNEAYNYFLSVLIPHNQLLVMPYNRVVLDLAGKTKAEFLTALDEKFSVEKSDQKAPVAPLSFGMYLDKEWYQLKAKPKSFAADHITESLDASVLQNNLLAPILQIENPRTDPRVVFVGGIRGAAELERQADASGGAAFYLYATEIEQVMAVADAGEVMPPKSTWFEPKMLSGLVVRPLD
jgi:uncharacterized protein (DUF1015 family)